MIGKSRIRKARELMMKNGVDALLVVKPENVYYFTNYRSASFGIHSLLFTVLIPLDGDIILIVPKLDVEMAEELSFTKSIRTYDYRDPIKAVVEVLEDLRLTHAHIGLETDYLIPRWFDVIKKKMPYLKFVDCTKLIDGMRSIKSEEEVKYMRKSCEIVSSGMQVALECVNEGASELDVLAEALYTMIKEGSEQVPTGNTVLTGKRTLFPDLISSPSAKIKRGEPIIIDLGATYHGYISDMCRTVVLGKATQTQEKIYASVLTALRKGVKAVKPGIKATEVGSTAREIIIKAGYANYVLHGMGHGVGLEVHDKPSLSRDDIPLEPGMIFTVEPAVYIPDIGGFRLEDVVLVKPDGYEVLTKVSHYPLTRWSLER